MKVTFIYPKFEKFLETYPDLAAMPAIKGLWDYSMPPAMGIPIMVDRLPEGVEWRVIDQNVEPMDYDDDADLFALSYFTPQAGYAYSVGDELMRRGKTVIMGGMHPSMLPEDAAPHCDSLCIGEAERVWHTILSDYSEGQLKPIYKAEEYPVEGEIGAPRHDVFSHETRYNWKAPMVSITRGCPFRCDWCNIPLYQGRQFRFRPMDEVVAEIESLAGQDLYIVDDQVMLRHKEIEKYMIELCERIADYKVLMFLACSPAMNTNPEFLDAIFKAGTVSVYMVFASDPYSAKFFRRHPRTWSRLLALAKMFEDRGIRLFGSFGVGYDNMGEDQFDIIADFFRQARMKTAEFFIATPFPGTPLWTRTKAQDRLFLPPDWNKYNCANVVFQPKQTSPETLLEGFIGLWQEFYRTADLEEAVAAFKGAEVQLPKAMTAAAP